MKRLKLVLSFTFTVFFTIGMLANQNVTNDKTDKENKEQVKTEESEKVSAVESVSLFNFFKVESSEEETENNSKDDIKDSNLIKAYNLAVYFYNIVKG